MTEVRESWNESADAWIAHIRSQPAGRIGLIDPVMLEFVRQCDPRSVVDIGCGEGRFCRLLKPRYTVGLDPTLSLIESAQAQDPEGDYLRSAGEQLPFADATFDMAVSYLVLIDIPDFRAAITEMARVVRPGGHVLVANLNGFATTTAQGWLKDADDNRLYVPVDNYNDEIAHIVEFCNIRIVNYHRPLQDYMQAFLGNGLILNGFVEPRPTAEALRQWPALESENRVPFFNVMLWQKPCL